MKIAILSDAHGNNIYFQRCLEAIKEHNPEKIVFLGDCFGYMREGNVILNSLRQLDSHILMGNHEAMILGKIQYSDDKEEIYGFKIDRQNISDSNLKYIEGLDSEYCEKIDDKKILYVHGRPDNSLNGYLYADDKLYDWPQSQNDFVFMGHTHYPYIKKAGTTTYVNVGSSGLPRDVGNAPCYAIFNTQTGEVAVHRVLIDENTLKEVLVNDIHPAVYECLMRKGKRTHV